MLCPVLTHSSPALPCGNSFHRSPAGSGSILSVVTEDGSLALLDVCQPLAVRPSFNARQARLRQVLSTHSTPAALTHNTPGHITPHTATAAPAPAPAAAAAGGDAAAASGAGSAAAAGGVGGAVRVPVVLSSPGPLGSSMLLKQPWVLLLRFLLQVGGWGWRGGYSSSPLSICTSNSTTPDDAVAHSMQMAGGVGRRWCGLSMCVTGGVACSNRYVT
jgi:hypothetical protein